MLWKTIKVVLLVFLVLFVLCWVMLIAAIPFNAKTPSETDLSKSALKAKPPAPLAKKITLKIVTFNAHDMYVISWNRTERMKGIADALRELDPDIVGFQEIWIEKDRKTLMDALGGTRLKYCQYYPSGFLGSGKFIVSAFPIKEAFFHRYTHCGKWYKPYHGDWWAGKGVALARLELPEGAGYVDFYDTHAHAGYGSHEYDGDRESELEEMASFINESSTGTSPIFAVGDFNCREGSAAFANLVNGAHLEWMMKGEPRIDNIFAAKSAHYAMELLDSAVIDRRIPIGNRQVRLSDHNGYISTIRVQPK